MRSVETLLLGWIGISAERAASDFLPVLLRWKQYLDKTPPLSIINDTQTIPNRYPGYEHSYPKIPSHIDLPSLPLRLATTVTVTASNRLGNPVEISRTHRVIGLARGIGRFPILHLCLPAERVCHWTLEAGSVFVRASSSRHQRHCVLRRPWADRDSCRCPARSHPYSHSVCCWDSRTGQGSRLHRLRWLHRRRGRPRCCTRCSVAGSGSPPLRIGSQANQLNCSDLLVPSCG
jgi:hypothetical protein